MKERGAGAARVKPSAHVAKARACQRRGNEREREEHRREEERQRKRESVQVGISGVHPYADPH